MQKYLRFLWVLPILALTGSGVSKLLGAEPVASNMAAIGFADITFAVGVVELLSVIAFLIPKTRGIGFLLCCSFLGGVIALEWGLQPGPPIPGIVLASLLWAGMYFERPEIFGLKA